MDIEESIKVEEKWQKEWEKEKLFEAKPSAKKKKFITAAFPYPNSPQHIGHGRTYTMMDIHARYWRMKGYNVLCPMGFHLTGTPIISMAKRIEEGDMDVYSLFEDIYNIPRETTATLKDPHKLVRYFSTEIEAGMKRMGLMVDWRRKFYTTDPAFKSFIQWQFKKLHKNGLIKKGSHPIPWSMRLNSAVGAHDTKGEVDPELEEVCLIKFPFEDGYVVVSTYRPETVYGVTNVWINKNGAYGKFRCNGDIYYLSEEAAECLSLQLNLKKISSIDPEYFLRKTVKNPVTNSSVPIFHADFVKVDEGTGIVMSVPAHAPYDYVALRDMGKEMFVKIIHTEGFSDCPARDVVDKYTINNQGDPSLELATKELYKKEAHHGRMIVKGMEGMLAKDAKEEVKKLLSERGFGFSVWVIANAPVYTRLGDKVTVNIVENQWFIDYGNEQWKKDAEECLGEMVIIPEETRKDYEYTISWLKEKACTRSMGLGTAFPFDTTQIIESLSDSTIYMAFYTIAHLLDLSKSYDDEFFDFVMLGKNGKEEWKEMREEFCYWYPLDARHSAIDLIHNHLTFFIFNHTAIFPKECWPKGIFTNGLVLMEGKKMSKSLGNILPLRKAIEKYGADVIRIVLAGSSDLTQDTDFGEKAIEGVRTRLSFLGGLLKKIENKKEGKLERWLYQRLARKISYADEHYAKLMIKDVINELFYDAINDLRWYVRRSNNLNLRKFFEYWTLWFGPIAPHLCEEFWHVLGKKKYVKGSKFIIDSEMSFIEEEFDEKIEMSEEIVKKVLEDVNTLLSVLKTKPRKIYFYVASEWKREVYNKMREEKSIKEGIALAKKLGKELPQEIVKRLSKHVHSLEKIVNEDEELEALAEAKTFFERELGCSVDVLREEEGLRLGHKKASMSMPSKPAIIIE